MTEEELKIAKGDYEIASFMNVIPNSHFSEESWSPEIGDGFRGSVTHRCRYYKDWNLLMEVIAKIESMGFHFEIKSEPFYVDEHDAIDFSRTQHLCLILKQYSIVINSAGHGNDKERNDKKRAVWLAIVEFIKLKP